MVESKRKKEVFGQEQIEVIYRKSRQPAPMEFIEAGVDSADGLDEKDLKGAAMGCCAPFNQRSYLAGEGILCEQDVPVRLRDGTVIYTDIFRPVNEGNLPAIVSWSHYGKRPGEGFEQWRIIGVPTGAVSRMAKFESPDPGFWCRNGYAVANVDPRGVGHSEGDITMYSTQDGRDGYDFIEWIAGRDWCNGKVGMSGNSALAMAQWRIAAEQPPHLACIAPWEGKGDIYRESLFEGGIPALGFTGFLVGSMSGQGYVNDLVAMAKEHPLLNAYWEDKIPAWSKIRVPVYTTVGWSHFHLRGSMEGFRKIGSTKKWLRAHRDFEWPDYYCTASLNDLKLYFDRYLKGINNGWEFTPRVRLDVMDAFEFDYQTNRAEKEFPLARTQYKRLYINAGKGALSFDPVAEESRVSYDGPTGFATFDVQFDEDTEITGFMKLHLWVQAEGNDEMDLFVTIQKLDEQGNWLPVNVLGEPHPGAWGKMRVSHRELDPELSTDFQPVQAHRREQKLKPGEIVHVDIEIWPHSRIWHKGEQLRVLLSGHYIREGWFEPFSWETENRGNHIIHSGGQYDSYLQVPVVPPKYRAGDYVYR